MPTLEIQPGVAAVELRRLGKGDDMFVSRWTRRLPLLLVAVCMVGSSGCGTNFDDILYQAGSTTGRTFLDLVLTDLANRLADSLNPQDAPDSGDDLDDDDDGDTPPPDGPAFGELTGDPDAGEGIFASNNCAACHCADAGGGCALSAPSLMGVAAEKLDDMLRGDAAHPGGKFAFTNQDIVDLEAWLTALDLDNG